ncbi:hypothetical protein AAG906_002853 [Vitis piasezkii]
MAAVGEHSDLVHQNSAGKSYGCGISGLAPIKAAVYLSMDSSGCFRDLGYSQTYQASLVLESSDSLRMTGFSFTAWTNAWRALDLIGIGDSLRQQHYPLQGLLAASMIPGLPTSEISFNVEGINGKHEVHSVQRRALVEALQNEVPSGTWWQMVAFQEPSFAGRTSMRGVKYFSSSHGFELKVLHLFGKGIRAGFIPYDDKNVPDELREIVESTGLETIISARWRYRKPWELQWGVSAKTMSVWLVMHCTHDTRPCPREVTGKWRGSKWGCRSMPERGDDDALILLRLLIW